MSKENKGRAKKQLRSKIQTMKDEITELLEAILKAIVTKPDEVKVTKTVDEMGVLLEVKLGEGDAGMVIGREGRTIQAIRTVMATVGAKSRARINVKLLVPERPSKDDGFKPARPRRSTGLDDIGL